MSLLNFWRVPILMLNSISLSFCNPFLVRIFVMFVITLNGFIWTKISKCISYECVAYERRCMKVGTRAVLFSHLAKTNLCDFFSVQFTLNAIRRIYSRLIYYIKSFCNGKKKAKKMRVIEKEEMFSKRWAVLVHICYDIVWQIKLNTFQNVAETNFHDCYIPAGIQPPLSSVQSTQEFLLKGLKLTFFLKVLVSHSYEKHCCNEMFVKMVTHFMAKIRQFLRQDIMVMWHWWR